MIKPKASLSLGILALASLLALTSCETVTPTVTKSYAKFKANDSGGNLSLNQQSRKSQGEGRDEDDAAVAEESQAALQAGTSLERRMARIQEADDLFETDYFDLVHHNITTDLWLNYTCQSLEVTTTSSRCSWRWRLLYKHII